MFKIQSLIFLLSLDTIKKEWNNVKVKTPEKKETKVKEKQAKIWIIKMSKSTTSRKIQTYRIVEKP